jgi:hypothetical protein
MRRALLLACMMALAPQHARMECEPSRKCAGPRQCLAQGCLRRRAYGFPRDSAHPPAARRPQFCAQHKAPGHINLMTRLCTAAGCTRAASFGPAGAAGGGGGGEEWRPSGAACRLLRCAEHRAASDVDFRSRSKRCAFLACRRQGSFGSSNGTLVCKVHARAGSDGDCKNRQCRHAGCSRRASFGTHKAEWCSHHRRPFDRNKRITLCVQDGCSNEASYGILGKARRRSQRTEDQEQPASEEERLKAGVEADADASACRYPSTLDARKLVVKPLFCPAHARASADSARVPRMGSERRQTSSETRGDDHILGASTDGHAGLVSRLGYGAAGRKKAKEGERRRWMDELISAFHHVAAAAASPPKDKGAPGAAGDSWGDPVSAGGGKMKEEFGRGDDREGSACCWRDLVAAAESVLRHQGRLRREALVPHMLLHGVLQTGAFLVPAKCALPSVSTSRPPVSVGSSRQALGCLANSCLAHNPVPRVLSLLRRPICSLAGSALPRLESRQKKHTFCPSTPVTQNRMPLPSSHGRPQRCWCGRGAGQGSRNCSGCVATCSNLVAAMCPTLNLQTHTSPQ